jgi:ribA/ribD-fused uncharacterized protein
MIDSFKDEYRFLSNFYPCVVEFEGRCYSSVEHAYQAAKTTNELDRIRIQGMTTPGRAKRLGRTVVIRSDWDSMRLDIMRSLVEQKFADSELARMLNDTGNQELVEGNTWGDTFWGVCKGVGENHLGRILMGVRDANRIFFLDTTD